jgi:hypothetical protein|tara:strand:+ start:170 stop:340 length:171 start_codon:yes stop_codon:yes gene_type:complete
MKSELEKDLEALYQTADELLIEYMRKTPHTQETQELLMRIRSTDRRIGVLCQQLPE